MFWVGLGVGVALGVVAMFLFFVYLIVTSTL